MLGKGKNVELVIDCHARLAVVERQDKPLVEARLHNLMRLGSEPGVHVHRDRVELLEGSQRVKEHDDNSTTLNCLQGPAEHVGRDRLEVLQDAHAEGLTQDLVRVLVVAITNV